MSFLLVPWYASCWVLLLAGAAKLRSPDPTRGALRSARLPSSVPMVLALAIFEILLGLAGVSGNRFVAGAVAATYLGFAAFVAVALRRGTDIQSCGCFGSDDIPASMLHLAVDLVAAVTAVAVAAAGVPPISAVFATAATGLVIVGLAMLATAQVVLLLTTLPRVVAERQKVEAAFGW